MNYLMCSPKYYDVFYQINPWMKQERAVNHKLAIKQWEYLYEIMQKCGAEISLIEPIKGLPDMVFTANAGLVYENKACIAQFNYPQRQGESVYFENWFIEQNYKILPEHIVNNKKLSFEGMGDALLAENTLYLAHGFRSHPSYYEYFTEKLNIEVISLHLLNPNFYHLDTCFCPLNNKQALWYPPAFSNDSQLILNKHLDLFAVSKEEAEKFACNAIVIDKSVILPVGCDNTGKYLSKLGFDCYTCDMSEFMLAGGACKCLTLKL